MLNNLLLEYIEINGETITKANLGEAALYAVIGFAVVFLGIAFLVLVVWAVGKIFEGVDKAKAEKKPVPQEPSAVQSTTDEVDDETIAVISAAIAAYYQKQAVPCEFVIKKIKRSKF